MLVWQERLVSRILAFHHNFELLVPWKDPLSLAITDALGLPKPFSGNLLVTSSLQDCLGNHSHCGSNNYAVKGSGFNSNFDVACGSPWDFPGSSSRNPAKPGQLRKR